MFMIWRLLELFDTNGLVVAVVDDDDAVVETKADTGTAAGAAEEDNRSIRLNTAFRISSSDTLLRIRLNSCMA